MAPRGGKSTKGKGGDGAAASAPPAAGSVPGHNIKERTASFLTHKQILEVHDERLRAANEAMKGIKKARKTVRDAAKNDGWPLAMFDRILKDAAKTRGDLSADAALEAFMRETSGLPVVGKPGTQQSLFDEAPKKDATWWEAEGEMAGMANRPCSPPDGLSGAFTQAWTRGWHSAQERRAWALSERGVNPESLGLSPDVAPPAPPGRGDDDEDDGEIERAMEKEVEPPDAEPGGFAAEAGDDVKLH